ncbi:hypothetical protein BD413DRAFT_515055 [Trametes elegans]|nr:hypothetical protein BD413DRAFT_515055 [Trametes elegans]
MMGVSAAEAGLPPLWAPADGMCEGDDGRGGGTGRLDRENGTRIAVSRARVLRLPPFRPSATPQAFPPPPLFRLLSTAMKFTAAALSATLAALVSSTVAQDQELKILAPGGDNLWWVAGSDNVVSWTCQTSPYQQFTVLCVLLSRHVHEAV